jgi:hypothetical protein
MINIFHLFWIIPLSMLVGALTITSIACVIASASSDREVYDELSA